MYNLFDVPSVITNCLKKAMRNYEKELLDELRNSTYDGTKDHINEDSDEELSEIWAISGHMTITDLPDNNFQIYQDKQTLCSTRSSINNEGNSDNKWLKESLTDTYMRYIGTHNKSDDSNDVDENQNNSDNQSDLRTNKNSVKDNDDVDGDDEDDDYADDEGSDDDNDDVTSDSDDDMFEVCIKESLSRRVRILPHYDAQKSRQYDDDAEEEERPRPLTITPIKRRYTVQESLRVRVLRNEAAKYMSNIFTSKCSLDS